VVATGESGGTVAVDILTADLKPLKSLHVERAARPGVLLQTLGDFVSSLSLKPGEALVKPRRDYLAKDAGPNDLALHLTARGFIPGEFPAESWIVYRASELPQLIGQQKLSVGSEWKMPSELTRRLLIHVYPQEISSGHAEFNQIIEQRITSRIIAVERGIARARLDGRLVMDRRHGAPPTSGSRIEAALIGYMDLDLQKRLVLAFKFATHKATSDGRNFAVGVTSQRENEAETAAE